MNETLLAKAELMRAVIEANGICSERLKLQKMDNSNPMKKNRVEALKKRVERFESGHQFEDKYDEVYHLFGEGRQQEIYG